MVVECGQCGHHLNSIGGRILFWQMSTKPVPFALISLGHTVFLPVFVYYNHGQLILRLNYDNITPARHATRGNNETVKASIVDVILYPLRLSSAILFSVSIAVRVDVSVAAYRIFFIFLKLVFTKHRP